MSAPMTPERERELRAYFAGRKLADRAGQEVFAEVDRLREELTRARAEALEDVAAVHVDGTCVTRIRADALEETAAMVDDMPEEMAPVQVARQIRAMATTSCTCRPGHRRVDCPALVGAPSFPCCGGSDDHPPTHTQDCAEAP